MNACPIIRLSNIKILTNFINLFSETVLLPEDVWHKIAPQDFSCHRPMLSAHWTNTLLTIWKSDRQIKFVNHRFNAHKTPFLTINAECTHKDCDSRYVLCMQDMPQAGCDGQIEIRRSGNKCSIPHSSRQIRGAVRKAFSKQLIGKSATEFHYELVSQCADNIPKAAILKQIKSEDNLKGRNATDAWEDLRLESGKGEQYVQFRGECPLMIHLYTHSGMRLYSEKSVGLNRRCYKKFASLKK